MSWYKSYFGKEIHMHAIALLQDTDRSQTFAGELDISTLAVSPRNPRRSRPDAKVAELADHIKRVGYDVTRAVKIHRGPADEPLVFAGGTRLVAARRAGAKTIPVFEYTGYTEGEILRMAIEDNDADGQHNRVPVVDLWAAYAARYAEIEAQMRAAGEQRPKVLEALAAEQRCDPAWASRRIKWHTTIKGDLRKAICDGLIGEGHLEAVSGLICDVANGGVSLAAWLTTEQAQEEALREAVAAHRGKGAGPTVKEVREIAARWKTMLNAAEDGLEEIGGPGEERDSEGRWRRRFVELLTQMKARTEAEVHACRMQILQEQATAAEEARQAALRAAQVAQRQAEAEALTAEQARQEAAEMELLTALADKVVLGTPEEAIKTAPTGATLLLTEPPRDAYPTLPDLFTAVYERMAENGTALVFTDWAKEEKVQLALFHAGFDVIGSLVGIAVKAGTGAPGMFRPRHCRIVHAVKGEPKLHGTPDDVRHGARNPACDHPAAKPADMITSLLDATTNPGALVLDPYTNGGGMLLPAASCGRDIWGCEQSQRWHTSLRDALFQIAKATAAAAPKATQPRAKTAPAKKTAPGKNTITVEGPDGTTVWDPETETFVPAPQ